MDRMRVYGPDMRLLAVLEGAGPISYELPHNDLRTATFCLPSGDPKNAYCTGRNYIRLPDDGHETGLFRISGMPGAEMAAIGEVCTYSAEHVLATLLDDVIFGTLSLEDVPFDQAVRQLLDHQTVQRWALGGCEFSGAVTMEVENTTILGALRDLCGVLGQEYTWAYDTTALPWRLSIRRADEGDGCGIHYGRNMVGVKKTVDESQIVTRLYLQGGAGDDGKQVTVRGVNGDLPYIDADTIGDYWPPRCQIYTNAEITDPAQLLAKGRQVLESYKEPYVSYTAQALDLSAVTGENWDRHEPGKMVRVMDDESGVNFRARIVSFGKKDMLGRPREATITIANKARDALDQAMSAASLAQHAQDTTIRDACRTQTALRASDTMVNELTGRIVECESSVEVTADGVRLLNERTDTLGDDITEARAQILLHDGIIGILSERSETIDGRVTRAEAAIEVNASTGVALSHRLDTAEAAIEVNAENGITLFQRIGEAEASIEANTETGVTLSSRIGEAESAISAMGGQITLKADKIDLQGLVTASQLEATQAAIEQAISATVNTGEINAEVGYIMDIEAVTINGSSASWENITVGGTVVGQVLSPAPISFNWSDIDEVKDAISAAKTEGASGVTLSRAWGGNALTVTATNGKSVTETLTASSASGTLSTFTSAHKLTLSVGATSIQGGPLFSWIIDATGEYNAGVSAGSEAVTIAAANIVRNRDDAYNSTTHNTSVQIKATASNGASNTQTFTVDGTNAYNAGVSAVTISSVEYLSTTWVYDADYKGFTVSFRATASNGATKTETIHDTLNGCYNAGYNSGEGSVDVSTHSVSTIGSERVMTIKLSNGKVRSYAV